MLPPTNRGSAAVTAPSHATHRIVSKLATIAPLAEGEREAIERLPIQIKAIASRADLTREGDRPSRFCVLLDGWACSHKVTGAGRRQIMAFHLPGDLPGLQSLHLRTLDSTLTTLTPCQVGFIEHEALRELFQAQPRIAEAFWSDTLVEGSIFREWLLNVGQREARSRLAHVLCELVMRIRALGLNDADPIQMPITQTDLAEAMGMSTVHVNRMLQALRGAGLITLERGALTVHDWAGLKQAGDFDASYLHLRRRMVG